MKAIPLHGKKAAGRVALVDDADYDLVMQYRWHVWERVSDGQLGNGPYAVAHTYKGTHRITIKMHTLLVGFALADHRDGNGLNNQRQNLRDATSSQNNRNRSKSPGCASRFKGVTRDKRRQKWQAGIWTGERQRFLGYFADEVDAAKAYDREALAAWGEYAKLNFPPLSPPIELGGDGRGGNTELVA